MVCVIFNRWFCSSQWNTHKVTLLPDVSFSSFVSTVAEFVLGCRVLSSACLVFNFNRLIKAYREHDVERGVRTAGLHFKYRNTETRNEVKNDHRSKFSNLSSWKEEAWKKSGLRQDSNPWPPRYRCDALPTELWSHTLGARSIYWVHMFSCSEVIWCIYEIIHFCTAVVDEVKNDHRSKFSNLSNLSLKNSGLQRDSNPWPPRYQ